MAEPRRKTSGATVDKSNTVGEYTELPGGGTPIEAGKRAPSDAWVAEHRKLQPRDGEGKFTYNSANRKKLEYGPSRGTTVPPFLEGINLTYAIKSKSPLIIGGKNGIDPQRLVARRDLDIDSFMDIFKEYDVEKGSFKGFTNAFEKKKGRQSKVEKQMLSGKKTGVTKPGDEEVREARFTEKIEDLKSGFPQYKARMAKLYGPNANPKIYNKTTTQSSNTTAQPKTSTPPSTASQQKNVSSTTATSNTSTTPTQNQSTSQQQGSKAANLRNTIKTLIGNLRNKQQPQQQPATNNSQFSKINSGLSGLLNKFKKNN